MPEILASYPSLPCFTQTVTLGDTQYQVRLTWYDRLGAWYMDLLEHDGTPIAGGRRLSSQVSPLGLLLPPEAPADGQFFVRGGGDPYERDWLGTDIQLQWFSNAEILAGAPDDDDLVTVRVP